MLKDRFLRGFPLVVLALVVASAAHAQSPLGIGSAEPGIAPTGPFGPLLATINAYQQEFYRSLTAALRAMREDPSKLWALIGLSFAYGVFHAAGPGHGKAVISSYMVANEVELRRGVFISFVSAFLQGVTAIATVTAAWVLLRGTGISMTTATTALERASFALIALFGAWLLVRKVRLLLPVRSTATATLFAAADDVGHVHGPDCRHGFGDLATVPAQNSFVCESCGHAHLPAPAALAGGRFGASEAWSAVIAVGLRPCSGALLVLSFSMLNGLMLGGILSVAAMALGTAITVSALAILAVAAKGMALHMAGAGSRANRIVGHVAEIGGALFILVIGLLLLGASLQN